MRTDILRPAVAAALLLVAGRIGPGETTVPYVVPGVQGLAPTGRAVIPAPGDLPAWWHGDVPTADAIYTGDRLNGLPHGTGTLRLRNGDVYVGTFRRGRYHGDGEYSWADGHRYIGRYDQGRKSGRGIYTRSDGFFFDGEWRDGQPAGGRDVVLFNGAPYTARAKDGRYVLTGVVAPAGGLLEGRGTLPARTCPMPGTALTDTTALVY